MADISMCNNKECKLNNNCYRYLAKASEYMQSYITDTDKNCVEDDYAYYWEVKKI